MPACCAYGCNNRSENGFLLKVFPRDVARRALWAAKVKRDKWKPTSNSYLCEVHFDEDQWEKPRVDGKKKLKLCAVPTLFCHLPLQKEKRKSPKKKLQCTPNPIKRARKTISEHVYTLQQIDMNDIKTEFIIKDDLHSIKNESKIRNSFDDKSPLINIIQEGITTYQESENNKQSFSTYNGIKSADKKCLNYLDERNDSEVKSEEDYTFNNLGNLINSFKEESEFLNDDKMFQSDDMNVIRTEFIIKDDLHSIKNESKMRNSFDDKSPLLNIIQEGITTYQESENNKQSFSTYNGVKSADKKYLNNLDERNDFEVKTEEDYTFNNLGNLINSFKEESEFLNDDKMFQSDDKNVIRTEFIIKDDLHSIKNESKMRNSFDDKSPLINIIQEGITTYQESENNKQSFSTYNGVKSADKKYLNNLDERNDFEVKTEEDYTFNNLGNLINSFKEESEFLNDDKMFQSDDKNVIRTEFIIKDDLHSIKNESKMRNSFDDKSPLINIIQEGITTYQESENNKQSFSTYNGVKSADKKYLNNLDERNDFEVKTEEDYTFNNLGNLINSFKEESEFLNDDKMFQSDDKNVIRTEFIIKDDLHSIKNESKMRNSFDDKSPLINIIQEGITTYQESENNKQSFSTYNGVKSADKKYLNNLDERNDFEVKTEEDYTFNNLGNLINSFKEESEFLNDDKMFQSDDMNVIRTEFIIKDDLHSIKNESKMRNSFDDKSPLINIIQEGITTYQESENNKQSFSTYNGVKSADKKYLNNLDERNDFEVKTEEDYTFNNLGNLINSFKEESEFLNDDKMFQSDDKNVIRTEFIIKDDLHSIKNESKMRNSFDDKSPLINIIQEGITTYQESENNKQSFSTYNGVKSADKKYLNNLDERNDFEVKTEEDYTFNNLGNLINSFKEESEFLNDDKMFQSDDMNVIRTEFIIKDDLHSIKNESKMRNYFDDKSPLLNIIQEGITTYQESESNKQSFSTYNGVKSADKKCLNYLDERNDSGVKTEDYTFNNLGNLINSFKEESEFLNDEKMFQSDDMNVIRTEFIIKDDLHSIKNESKMRNSFDDKSPLLNIIQEGITTYQESENNKQSFSTYNGVKSADKKCLNNLNERNDSEVKTEEDCTFNNLGNLLNSFKEESEFLNDDKMFQSDLNGIGECIHSDKIQLKIEYADKIFNIEKEIIEGSLFESEIEIEKNSLFQILNEEKSNDSELMASSKLILNELTDSSSAVDQNKSKSDLPYNHLNNNVPKNQSMKSRIKYKQLVNSSSKKECFECQSCGKQFYDQSNYEKHTMIHFNGSELTNSSTLILNELTDSINEVDQNKSKSDLSNSYLSNNVPKNQSMKSRTKYKQLVNSSSKKKCFECLTCGKQFSDQSNCIKHTRIHFNNSKLTDSSTLIFKELNDSSNDVDQNKSKSEKHFFICDLCHHSFNYKRKLVIHMKRHFPNNLSSNNVSKNQYMNSRTKYKQLVNPSSKKKCFECQTCGKQFFDQSNCIRHTKIHFSTIQNIFKCNICMKTYNRIENFQVHYRMHTEKKPYKCDICELTFYRNDLMLMHKRKVHGTKISLFHCKICKKSYMSNFSLFRHEKIHENEKPYSCNNCQQSFYRKDSLVVHLRSKHTGERPYHCHICKKSFFENKVLVCHIKTHKNG